VRDLEPDPRARLELLYHSYADQVSAYARRRTSHDEAMEVVSETFLVAWRRLDAIPGEPLPWLYEVAHKLLANQRRSLQRRQALSERLWQRWQRQHQGAGGGISVDPADEVGSRLELLAAIRRLPPLEREAICLVAWEGFDNRRAAQVLGCSAAAFAVRLHRGRRHLLQELGVAGPGGATRQAARQATSRPIGGPRGHGGSGPQDFRPRDRAPRTPRTIHRAARAGPSRAEGVSERCATTNC